MLQDTLELVYLKNEIFKCLVISVTKCLNSMLTLSGCGVYIRPPTEYLRFNRVFNGFRVSSFSLTFPSGLSVQISQTLFAEPGLPVFF